MAVLVRRSAAVAAAIAAATAAIVLPMPRLRAQTPPPDILLIVTDDQRADSLDAMPTVERELAARGTTFRNAFAPTPLCCPARASILTGNYAHTTLVYRNSPPFGRAEWFDDRSTLATWLHDGGYTTAHIGKYLNGYQHAAVTGVVPPGWDRWVAFIRPAYTDYALTFDGVVERGITRYSTDLLADEAVAFVEAAQGPLFLSFAPYAPHPPFTPADRDRAARVPRRPAAPSAGEVDVSDKPAWVRSLRPLGPLALEELARSRRDADRSLLAADRAIGRILDALDRAGRLDRTLVVFTSDQGILFGEHRWFRKEVPYDEAIRIPLVVRVPTTIAAPRGVVRDELVANVDLAPTIADLAGVEHPVMEGASLVPLLLGAHPPWRDAVLLEHLSGGTPVPSYCGVRTATATYVRYGDGEEELYDLVADPFQLQNHAAAPADPGLLDDLRALTRRLCNPPPPGMEGGQGRSWAIWSALAAIAILAAVESRRARRDSTA